MLEKLPQNLFDYLKFLRALALMVAKMAAKNKEAQLKLGHFVKTFNFGLKKYSHDNTLCHNVCYAISSLCYTCP